CSSSVVPCRITNFQRASRGRLRSPFDRPRLLPVAPLLRQLGSVVGHAKPLRSHQIPHRSPIWFSEPETTRAFQLQPPRESRYVCTRMNGGQRNAPDCGFGFGGSAADWLCTLSTAEGGRRPSNICPGAANRSRLPR